MTNIGHNRPPRDEALTPAKKIERILTILDREGLTSAQKCVGVKIIAEADRDGAASVRTPELMRAASARDRETVFRATKALGDVGIEKTSGLGQAGRYVVLPDRVVAAVVEAYESKKSGRHKPDQLDDKSSGETRPVATSDPVGSGPTSPNKPVGLNSTSTVEPVGMNPTGRHEPDQSRARVDSNINNNNINNLASVGDNSPREAGQLAILNGAKAIMVEQLATWLSPYAPDTVTAEKWLVTATTMHGGPVVKEAFGELQAQIASGDLIGRPIVVLNRICERIKKRPAQNREGKSPSRDEAMRLINTIAGGKR